jgi:acetyl-CoA acetyltransferase
MESIKDRYAIVGIGQSPVTLRSGRSELSLALEAVTAAIEDAGLHTKDIDGIMGDHPIRVDAMAIAGALGLRRVGFFIEPEFAGGGVPGGIMHALAGIAAGRAEHVVCYKSLNGASKVTVPGMAFDLAPHENGFTRPFGLLDPAAYAGLAARRHMHEYGTTSRHFGAIAVTCRRHANRNSHAIMHDRPLTLEDHQQSELLADPLRILDRCVDVDGAAACIVTTAERARDLRQRPVYIMAAGQALSPCLARGTKDPTLPENETSLLSRQLFSMAGLTPSDIDVLQICDDFTCYVLMALEDLGFCRKGEGGGFVEGGHLDWPDGKIPLNTSGGNLSEGNLEGFNHIVEGVRQLRGAAQAQVGGAETVLVCGATGTATSGLILRR